MCWGCMHPSFPDPPSSPFFQEVALTPSFLGLTVDQYAAIIGVGAIAVLGAHMTRKALTKKEEEERKGDGGGKKKTTEAPAKPGR